MIFDATSPFGHFLQRVSVEPYPWLDVQAAFSIDASVYSSIDELVLFADRDEQVTRAISEFGLDTLAIKSTRTSPRPIHDGFVTAVELTTTGDPSTTRDFHAQERRRDAEQHLRECYGRDSSLEDHVVFRLMDYPVFDQGTAHIGFGFLRTDDARWLWSRVVFSHK